MKFSQLHPKSCANLDSQHRGFTLLELLLYIALYTIVIFGFIKTYVSLVSSYEWYQDRIHKNEIAFYVYEIARYVLDAENSVFATSSQVTDMATQKQYIARSTERILKFYPKYRLKNFSFTISDQLQNPAEKIVHISFDIENSMISFDILVL